ncbi:hypothetical protein ACJX0J_040391, partial [Zea mays]
CDPHPMHPTGSARSNGVRKLMEVTTWVRQVASGQHISDLVPHILLRMFWKIAVLPILLVLRGLTRRVHPCYAAKPHASTHVDHHPGEEGTAASLDNISAAYRWNVDTCLDTDDLSYFSKPHVTGHEKI